MTVLVKCNRGFSVGEIWDLWDDINICSSLHEQFWSLSGRSRRRRRVETTLLRRIGKRSFFILDQKYSEASPEGKPSKGNVIKNTEQNIGIERYQILSWWKAWFFNMVEKTYFLQGFFSKKWFVGMVYMLETIKIV